MYVPISADFKPWQGVYAAISADFKPGLALSWWTDQSPDFRFWHHASSLFTLMQCVTALLPTCTGSDFMQCVTALLPACTGSDFSAFLREVNFSVGNDESCFGITISEDSIAEAPETFTVLIISGEGRVLAPPPRNQVTVIILDNEGITSAALGLFNRCIFVELFVATPEVHILQKHAGVRGVHL